MVTDIHLPTAAVVIFLAIVLLAWLIKRNLKDEKKFEKSLNESELKPDRHEKDSV